jgi:hypothetical protein
VYVKVGSYLEWISTVMSLAEKEEEEKAAL